MVSGRTTTREDVRAARMLNSQQDETLIDFFIFKKIQFIHRLSLATSRGNGWPRKGKSGLCRSPQTRGR